MELDFETEGEAIGVHMELITETFVVREGVWPERGCPEEWDVASCKPGGRGGREGGGEYY